MTTPTSPIVMQIPESALPLQPVVALSIQGEATFQTYAGGVNGTAIAGSVILPVYTGRVVVQ